MNPQPGAGAVEAVAGAGRPLATLQALAEALGALGMAGAPAGAAEQAGRAAAADAATADTPPEAVPPGGPALAAQAAQGRATLGQLAAEAPLRRSAEGEAAAPPGAAAGAAAPALRPGLAPEGINSPRLPDLLAVPVSVSALHTPPLLAPHTRRQPAPRRRTGWGDEQRPPLPEAEGEEVDAEAVDAADAPRPEPRDEAPPDPEAERLCRALERAGRADAAAELARGRRLLLVLPQAGAAPVPALAWLLSTRRAQRHGARWWPGAAAVDGDARWQDWRVFRDGDPQLARGLHSRAAGPACRVRLGPQPPRLPDAGAASLAIAERLRFAQALGGQWSLLLLVAPAGWQAD